MSTGFIRDYVVKATGETDVYKSGTPVATTSGTEVDFSIPSGVKEIKVMVNGVSSTTITSMAVRLEGDSGIETTGYTTVAGYLNDGGGSTANTNQSLSASMFHFSPSIAATYTISGIATLTLMDAATNTWVCKFSGSDYAGTNVLYSSGAKTLSGELTVLRFLTTAGTFDAGSVNVQYDNPELAVSGIESVAAGVTDVFVNGTKQASTSGTEVEFTLPSGIKEFKLALAGVSASAAQTLRGRFSVAGAYVSSTTYEGNASYITGGAAADANNYATNVGITLQGVAAEAHSGLIHFTLLDAATNTWCWTGSVGSSTADTMNFCCGSIILTGELDGFKVYVDSGTLDAGSINIQYDNQELDLGSGVISGGVVQTVNTQDGEFSSGTTVMPLDDTIPQSTEGVEFLTASITPTDVANKLRIDVVLYLSHTTTSSYMLGALFQDSTASALAAAHSGSAGSAGGRTAVTFTHWMDAGTTSSTTFKVRAGNANAGTTRLNGGTTRSLGGVLASSITITEYKA